MKNKKLILIISSVVILLPVIFGLVFWNSLPESLSTHFGADGKADGSMSKMGGLFVLPLVLLLFHWLCIWMSDKFSGRDDQNPKMRAVVYWIIPAISIFVNGIIYAEAYGFEFNMISCLLVFMGLLFAILGNYLPKCKQNLTLGIKLRWTLANEENWNATHRMAGKLWFIGGIVMMLGVFLPSPISVYFMFGIIMLMVIIPTVYSFVYYKKQVKEGSADKKPVIKMDESYKKMGKKILTVVIMLLLVICTMVFFTGFEAKIGETAFSVNAFGCDNITVEYGAIESIELRDKDFSYGVRTYGYGGFSLLMGKYQNEEFGKYTLYAYTKSDKCVVVKVKERYLVFACETTEKTEQLYTDICDKLNENGR